MEKLKRRLLPPYKGSVLIPEVLSEEYHSFVDKKLGVYNQSSMVPNVVAWSSMFSTIRKRGNAGFSTTEWNQVTEIMRSDVELEIWHKGRILNQDDLTVYLYLLKIAPPNLEARTTPYRILRFFNKKDSGQNYEWARKKLENLQQAQFAFYEKTPEKYKKKRMVYFGPLLFGITVDEEGVYTIPMKTHLAALLRGHSWSFINMQQRMALGDKPKALAFLLWLNTHSGGKSGFHVKKEDLMRSFSPDESKIGYFFRDFKRDVINPLLARKILKKVEYKPTAVSFYWEKELPKKIEES